MQSLFLRSKKTNKNLQTIYSGGVERENGLQTHDGDLESSLFDFGSRYEAFTIDKE